MAPNSVQEVRKDNETQSSGATPYNVRFSVEDSPGHMHVQNLQEESANKVSELLMTNHAKYHNIFNNVGLHNHIVHHLCTLWALGASPDEIQTAYALNNSYQVPMDYHGDSDTLNMQNPAVFQENLGHSEAYSEYLRFFQSELSSRGVEETVREYLFKGDKRADNLLGRVYAGFVHPILHLGFGLEFNQPCLVAEALASTCIHDDSPLAIVIPAEEHLRSHPDPPQSSLLSLLHTLRANPTIANAASTSKSPNRLIPLMKQAAHLLPPILSQWRVEPTEEDIAYKMTEMIHVCTYTLGAAQNPRKEPSIEFFMMHSENLSTFFPVFMGFDWLSLEQKARLLAWKGWMDLTLYAANGCPALYHERITNYTPKKRGDWASIIARVNRYPDDGHTSKFIRALKNAENHSTPTNGTIPTVDLPLHPTDFLQIAHMTMDSVERMLEPDYRLPEELIRFYKSVFTIDDEVIKIVARFVRWSGVEESWDTFPDLKQEEKSRL